MIQFCTSFSAENTVSCGVNTYLSSSLEFCSSRNKIFIRVYVFVFFYEVIKYTLKLLFILPGF